LIIKPCDDEGLGEVHARRHTILARPSDAGVAFEMWARGLEHASRLAEKHEADLRPYLHALRSKTHVTCSTAGPSSNLFQRQDEAKVPTSVTS